LRLHRIDAEAAAGDPAYDLIPTGYLFGGDTRELFRAAADVGDTTWAMGARLGNVPRTRAQALLPHQ